MRNSNEPNGVVIAENGTRNVGHNEDVGKGSTEAKVEFKQTLRIGFGASFVDSLNDEATVGRMALTSAPELIMKRFRERFEQNHQATTPLLVPGVPVSREGAEGATSLGISPERLVVSA